jgi:macrolide-specific efflux system membrane fusion protein
VRRWVLTAVVVVALLAGGVFWRTRHGEAAQTQYLTATVTQGTVAQTVAVTGSVQPQIAVNLAFSGSTSTAGGTGGSGQGSGSGGSGSGSTGSTGSGTVQTVSSGAAVVRTVTASVGELVASGAVLATLDDTAAQAQLTSANAQLSSARARQAAEPSGVSATTVASDSAAVAQAQQQVDSAEQAVAATVLKAPVAGVVTAVDLHAGLPPTSPAITLRSSGLDVVAAVPEDALASLQAGQRATVTLPALSRTVTGTLGAMPTAASSGSGTAVTFPVTVDLASPPSGLLPGMSAQVTIVIAQRTDVLEVPTTAIQGSTTSPTVTVLQAGKPVSKPVEIGLSTNASTEIVAGLAVGDTVVTGVVNPTAQTTTTTTGGLGGGGLRGGGGLGGGSFRGGGFQGGVGG